MSDDFHRPTLTYPSGAYSATQVRLYGLLPDESPTGIVYPGKKSIFKLSTNPDFKTQGDLEVAISVTTGNDALDEKSKGIAEELLRKSGANNELKKDTSVFTTLLTKMANVSPDAPIAFYTQVSIEMRKFGKLALSAMITRPQALAAKKVFTCGVIVGYAYEGHTYDLVKPKIMIIPAFPEPAIPKDDSGYNEKPENYAVWLVDKLDECVEFELNQGFIEQIVLDANLPGKRSPNMYAGRMMMGHRSGRLSE